MREKLLRCVAIIAGLVCVTPALANRPCPRGYVLDDSGVCVPIGGGCTPTCGGRNCGSDGCRGSCGTCPAFETCSGSGQCYVNAAICDSTAQAPDGATICALKNSAGELSRIGALDVNGTSHEISYEYVPSAPTRYWGAAAVCYSTIAHFMESGHEYVTHTLQVCDVTTPSPLTVTNLTVNTDSLGSYNFIGIDYQSGTHAYYNYYYDAIGNLIAQNNDPRFDQEPFPAAAQRAAYLAPVLSQVLHIASSSGTPIMTKWRDVAVLSIIGTVSCSIFANAVGNPVTYAGGPASAAFVLGLSGFFCVMGVGGAVYVADSIPNGPSGVGGGGSGSSGTGGGTGSGGNGGVGACVTVDSRECLPVDLQQ
jgi:hypothetical protein